MNKSESIFVVKTVERCNINCTYCYFFNKSDNSYLFHPPLMPIHKIDETVQFITKGASEHSLNAVTICFHGGEPLMQKIYEFEYFCEKLIEYIPSKTKIHFSLQTNGLLISKKWLDVLAKYNVSISISIDGPKLLHDKYRIDHVGRGTFDRVINKIKYLKDHSTYRTKNFSVLSVINNGFNAEEIYHFFFKELELTNVDFLLPDNTHDDAHNLPANNIGIFLSQLFNLWIEDSPKKINIRLFNSILSRFFNKPHGIYGHGPTNNLTCLPLVTIASNGDLAPSDEFRSADSNLMKTGCNVSDTTLNELLEHKHFKDIETALNTLPKVCEECIWKKICCGGSLVNRYSKENLFNNPSVFCSDLKHFYREISISLLKKGMPVDYLLESISDAEYN